jgi:16S rRNA (guanine527-N7)-methyltransferase
VSVSDPNLDRDRALHAARVSRETIARLDKFIALLLARNQLVNLISSATAPQIWTRHVADSLQLLDLAEGRTWADLGTGGGFPGIVIACAFADQHDHAIHLVESREKKAAFLREVAETLDLPVQVHAGRIEEIGTQLPPIDVVTARALAPLPKLLPYIHPILRKGAKALLMKGQDIGAELTQASKYWNIDFELVPSKTDPSGRIMIVSGLTPRRS